MYKKSQLEASKFENQRKKLLRRIKKLDRKRTTIWITSIFTYAILGLIFTCCGLINISELWTIHKSLFVKALSLGMVAAIILSWWFFYCHKLDIQEQMKKNEQIKQLEDRIIEEIKQQELLEAK